MQIEIIREPLRVEYAEPSVISEVQVNNLDRALVGGQLTGLTVECALTGAQVTVRSLMNAGEYVWLDLGEGIRSFVWRREFTLVRAFTLPISESREVAIW